jgi:dihydroorotase-like cyclic amidohydrolase
MPVTCGVCPHHLFLTEDDVKSLKSFAIMKPPLKTHKDKDFLWKNMQYIDVIESDHAPHTLVEKHSDTPPFGVPGLETTLPLLLTAVHNGKLTIDRVIELCHTNPKKILNLKTDDSTKIEVDDTTEYAIDASSFLSKCKWSPFDGWKVRGKVMKVELHGKTIFENGKLLAKPGSGMVLVR